MHMRTAVLKLLEHLSRHHEDSPVAPSESRVCAVEQPVLEHKLDISGETSISKSFPERYRGYRI